MSRHRDADPEKGFGGLTAWSDRMDYATYGLGFTEDSREGRAAAEILKLVKNSSARRADGFYPTEHVALTRRRWRELFARRCLKELDDWNGEFFGRIAKALESLKGAIRLPDEFAILMAVWPGKSHVGMTLPDLRKTLARTWPRFGRNESGAHIISDHQLRRMLARLGIDYIRSKPGRRARKARIADNSSP